MKKLRILLVHNYYQQSGGEDVVFESEKKLLQDFGHEVVALTESNRHLEELGNFAAAKNAVWSLNAFNRVSELISRKHPDIAHIHNTWMMFSPSIYYALQKHSIPVVQTLHNYRLLCPGATFYRDGKVCNDCMKLPLPLYGVVHKCYRNSLAQSAIVATMLSYHRLKGTWHDQVDFYITLSEYAKQKFIQGGLPANKIITKPNFIDYRDMHAKNNRRYALFVGRLSPEKGIHILVKAFQSSDIPLYIVGDGPDRKLALELASQNNNVRYLGHVDRASLEKVYSQAKCLVVPSVTYENFPMNILEAFRSGIPVVASKIGSIKEIINEGETGLLFHPGDPDDLITKIQPLWQNQAELERMGSNARREYEEKYAPERNYQLLMDIYHRAIESKK